MGKILIIKGADFSAVSIGKVAVTPIDVRTPIITITPKGIVTIICENATNIYYTIDGTEPTTNSKIYTSNFKVPLGTIVKSISEFENEYTSIVVSKSYESITFTESDFEQGAMLYSANSEKEGETPDTTRIRLKEPIEVIPGEKYLLTKSGYYYNTFHGNSSLETMSSINYVHISEPTDGANWNIENNPIYIIPQECVCVRLAFKDVNNIDITPSIADKIRATLTKVNI